LYLTTVLDLYDRKIIGWSLSSGMSVEETSLAAWRMAIKNRSITKGLLFHSDRGVQYASKKFTNVVDSYKIIT
jgi:putative transposase